MDTKKVFFLKSDEVSYHAFIVSLLRAVNAKFRSDKPPQLQDLRVTEETELEAKD